MAKGKRRGHRAEDIIASHAMKHHDFIGAAEPERKHSQEQKEERIQRDHEQLEKEVVREMTREMAAEAGLPPNGAAAPAFATEGAGATAAPKVSEGPVAETLLGRGLDLLEEARNNAPRAFDDLRHKAEERLASLPGPVKRAIHRGEQAAALLLAPARIGLALARELFKAPLQLLNALRRRSA